MEAPPNKEKHKITDVILISFYNFLLERINILKYYGTEDQVKCR